MSRRFSLKQIEDNAFTDYFDKSFKFGGGGYFLFQGATVFLQGVSPGLLEQLLKQYSEHVYIDYPILHGFKKLGPIPDAFQKLKIFIEWYSRDVTTWQDPYSQAYRLLVILSMALPLLHHANGHVINLIHSREIGKNPPSAQLHIWLQIKLSRLHEWIPERYKSWSNVLMDANIRPDLSNAVLPELEKIKTYFHA